MLEQNTILNLKQAWVEHAPIKVQKAREFVDLDARTESGEVNGVDGLFNQG